MGSKTKKIHIWAATEETNLLMEELEGQRGETVPETEKNEKHQEIFFSYDIYMYDFDTNEKIPYTEEEYYAEFGQLTE